MTHTLIGGNVICTPSTVHTPPAFVASRLDTDAPTSAFSVTT